MACRLPCQETTMATPWHWFGVDDMYEVYVWVACHLPYYFGMAMPWYWTGEDAIYEVYVSTSRYASMGICLYIYLYMCTCTYLVLRVGDVHV